jgi:hypothetical protein
MELASNLSTSSAYNLPEITRQAAKAAILAHDANATDIIEILGLSDGK